MTGVTYSDIGLGRGITGGVALGIFSSLFLLSTGHVPGISGILGGLTQGFGAAVRWKLAFRCTDNKHDRDPLLKILTTVYHFFHTVC
jgi:hypothetical protein